MKAEEDAMALAEEMVRIGKHAGRNTIAVVSDMDQPLGLAVGNALEVKEAIDTLRGKGPEDLRKVVLILGSYMVSMAKGISYKDASEELIELIYKRNF